MTSAALALSLVLKATAVATAGLAAARLGHGSRASLRHVTLAATLGILLLLPIASLLTPPIDLAIPVPQKLAVTPSAPASTDARRIEPNVETQAAQDAPVGVSSFPVSRLLVGMWIAGVVLALLRVGVGLAQTRALRRSGIRWHDGQRITDAMRADERIGIGVDVLLHTSLKGPITHGIVRPAILLPADAVSWPADDLQRAIVHELEHVRRCDWLTQSLGHAIAAVYWFHPLVWLVRRQFALEAERACDDAVLRRAEATAYATQLITLAQRMLDERQVLAMASRGDLSARIRALLNGRQQRGPAGSVWISCACALALTLTVSLAPLRIVAATQSAATVGQTYDVASVKPCAQEPAINGQRRQEFVISPGRVIIQCRPLARIIFFAYAGIGNLENPLQNINPQDAGMLRGGPDWIRNDLFTIEATAEGTSDRGTLMGPMLRALLEDRFQLRTHREGEEAPMYALTVASGGLKMRPIGPDGCTSFDPAAQLSRDQIIAINLGDRPLCGNFTATGDSVNRRWNLGGQSLDQFAGTLSSVLDRYVMDRTGVTGRFNINLLFAMDDVIRPGVFGGRPVGPVTPNPDIQPAPSIFTALEEQLGLKLVQTRGPREFMVIDRVERPTPN